MKELRLPVATVGFIDSYSDRYRSVFGDIRNFESFKQLPVGSTLVVPDAAAQPVPASSHKNPAHKGLT